MSGAALPSLDPERLSPLLGAYETVRRAERRRLALSVLVVLLLALLSAWVAEVRPAVLWARGGEFFGYFGRILTLEGGDRAGQWVWMATRC
ncbi:MAG: hypothetical protein MUF65_10315 [Rubritepida sp.]|nr:hypothetical protein [Rubritepida sp.]